MRFISRLAFAGLLPVIVCLAACAPGTTGAPAGATAPAVSTAPAIATSVPATTTASLPTAAATMTSAPSSAPTTAPTTTSAPTVAPTAGPTVTIAPVATATRAATAPGIAPGGAVISGTGGTTVTALTIKGFLFKPEVLQVKVGTTVTWTNMDDINHSVTNGVPPTPGGAFDSGFFSLGQSVSFTFMQPGDYPYFCKRHNSMMATVKVVP